MVSQSARGLQDPPWISTRRLVKTTIKQLLSFFIFFRFKFGGRGPAKVKHGCVSVYKGVFFSIDSDSGCN